MEASATKAAMEASTAAMETPSPPARRPATAGVVAIERARARVGKDLAIDLKSDTCITGTPICEFEL
jgi:hypothetical protein